MCVWWGGQGGGGLTWKIALFGHFSENFIKNIDQKEGRGRWHGRPLYTPLEIHYFIKNTIQCVNFFKTSRYKMENN